ncbi:MAG: 30S ribosome-binding factor RbfA [Clostridiales bacterium]|jgi:ribosome-binding factor A|nr:30S ribosome-binding factor RbfA [Clostridiales bacterium]
MGNRILRINDEILRETANIIRSEISDPRVGVLTTVVHVKTSTDLKYCKIYVSIFGDEKEKEDALLALKNASGYIRKLLATRINLRNTPELTFILDDSLDQSEKIAKLLKEAQQENPNRG